MLCNIIAGIAAYSVKAFYVVLVRSCNWRQQPGVLCLQSMHSANLKWPPKLPPDLPLVIQGSQTQVQYAPLPAH